MSPSEFQAAVDAAAEHSSGAMDVTLADLRKYGRTSRVWLAEVTSSDGRRWGVGPVGPGKLFTAPIALCVECWANDALPGKSVCAGCSR